MRRGAYENGRGGLTLSICTKLTDRSSTAELLRIRLEEKRIPIGSTVRT